MIEIRRSEGAPDDRKASVPPSNTTVSHSSPRTIFANARDVAFVGAIYLYFAGFAYEALYYRFFSVRTDGAQAVYSYIVYGYDAIQPHFFEIVATVIALSCTRILCSAISSDARRTRALNVMSLISSAVVPAIAILAFPLLFSWAREAAEQRARDLMAGRTPTLTLVTLHLKSGAERQYDRAFQDQNRDTSLFLIAESKDAYYVLRPGARRTESETPQGRVYEVPRTDIDHAETIAQ